MASLDQDRRASHAQSDGNRCPSDADLLEYSRGELSTDQSQLIQKHLLACRACTSRSEGFVAAAGSSVANQVAPTVSMRSPAAKPSPIALVVAPAAGPLRPVPRQLGPYRLISLLGRGGMGMVFKASHTRLKRLVAVKVLPPSLTFDAGGAERLHREIEAAGAVRHPNVVYATDAGEDQGIVYLVMEYVEGIDLGQLVARRGALPIAAACEICRQVAVGLAHLHQRHLIHRDLKPTNLMLASDGTVKILDLGLARFLGAHRADEELTGDDHVLGTADYMSPEQASNPRDVDARSDIYSLGCTLFKLLAGRAPFGGDKYTSFGAKVLAHQQVTPPDLADLRPEVPPELAAALAKMLAKDQAARFQSATEVAHALAPWAANARLLELVPDGFAETCDRSPDGLFSDESPPPQKPPSSAPATAVPAPVTSPQPAAYRWLRPRIVASAVAALVVAAGLLGVRLLDRPAEYSEIAWPGGNRGKHSMIFDPVRGTLEAHSEAPQFIRAGTYQSGKARIRMTIDQTSVGWRNDAGVLLGYHEISHNDEYAARAQIIKITRMDRQLEKSTPRLMVFREVTTFDPRTGPQHDVRRAIDVPWPGRSPVQLEVALDNGQVVGIWWNGEKLESLTAPAGSAPILPVDTTGQVGLYNHGPRGSWFSELSFDGIHP